MQKQKAKIKGKPRNKGDPRKKKQENKYIQQAKAIISEKCNLDIDRLQKDKRNPRIAGENMFNEPHYCSEDENAFFFLPEKYCLTSPAVVLKDTKECIDMLTYMNRYRGTGESEILNEYNF